MLDENKLLHEQEETTKQNTKKKIQTWFLLRINVVVVFERSNTRIGKLRISDFQNILHKKQTG
jgi:hypothetical protein